MDFDLEKMKQDNYEFLSEPNSFDRLVEMAYYIWALLQKIDKKSFEKS